MLSQNETAFQRVEKTKYQISTRCETSRNGTEFRFLVTIAVRWYRFVAKNETPNAAEIRYFCCI